MSNKVRAKFQCDRIIKHGYGGTEVEMSAIHSPDGENKDFTDATPCGDFKMEISKGMPAADFFEPGKSYYLDISEAPEQ